MSSLAKPLSMYVGEDIEFSINDRKYNIYETQEWIIKKAIEENRPVILSVKRQNRYLIKIINYSKMDTNNFIDKEYKLTLDKTYKWYPEKKNLGKNWNIHFTFELLKKI